MTDLVPASDGRYHCPHCAYDTQLINRMAAHLRKRHGEHWTVTAVLVAPAPEPDEPEQADTAVDFPADAPEESKE
ncbi:MAG: hypothetical protein KDE20_15270 [Caldilineaceae bacterium]|nr:hypothetical protein [Caldilineaceae bacterium]